MQQQNPNLNDRTNWYGLMIQIILRLVFQMILFQFRLIFINLEDEEYWGIL